MFRAGARKSGREGEARIVKPEERVDHMPHTQHYPVEDVLVDLLEVCICTIRSRMVGLVFFSYINSLP